MKKGVQSKSSFVLSAKLRFWIIGVVILLVYGKALRFDFVGLDDTELIVENYGYISDLSNLPKAFTTHAFYNPNGAEGANVYYRPLLTVSFMLDSLLGGTSPKFYHLTNILLHIVSSLLLLNLLIKFRINSDLAFAATLLFAVHPVLTQAIAWIPGRNDSMLAVFVLAAFIYLINFLETKKISDLLFHFLFFGLSIFTKESGISIPLLGLLYVFLFRSFFQDISQQSFYKKSTLFLLTGYLLLLVPWYFLRRSVMANSTADLSFASLSHSFLENLPLFLQYIQKSVLPFNLSILSVPQDTYYLLSGFLISLIIFFLIKSKRKDLKIILFGFAWFSAFLLPAFVVHILTGFEHRVYLPLIGILLVFSEIDTVKNFRLDKTRSLLIVAGVFVVFLVLTISHADAFSSNYLFWKTAAVNSEHSALARMNYGLALSRNGEQEKAIEVYKEGLSINPDEPLIHNNLGIVYARKKMYAEAEAEFGKEIEINPAFSDAYFNLGILYEQTGNDSLMVKTWEKAIEINPKNTGAIKALERYRKEKKQ